MLKSLIGTLIAGEAKQLTRRAKGAVILYALAIVALAVGAGFLIGAGYIAAAARYDALNAAIGFGVGFIVLAMIFLVVNSVQARAWRRKREEERSGELKTLAATAVIAALPGLLKSRAGLAGILIPIAGLVALKIIDENRDEEEDEG